MHILLLIAWRNLWRRPKRTILTASTVALGLALLLITLGLNDGAHDQMVENAVRMGSGHVIIQAPGYQQEGGLERTLESKDLHRINQWAQPVKSAFPVESILKRVFASALASSADGTSGVQIMGVEPEGETRSSQFEQGIAQGVFIEAADQDGIVLGSGVAEILEVEPGDKIVLMAQTADSAEIESRLARVKGVLHSGQEELDQSLLLAPLEYVQSLLHLEGEVHQVAVLLDNDRQAERLAIAGRQSLNPLEILTWREALPELQDFIQLDDAGNYVFNTFLFLLIGFMVLNTLLMSVLERTRELALLDALGLSARKRFLLVLIEAFFVSLLASGAGFLLGFSVHLYLSEHGIPLDLFYTGEVSAAGVVIDPILYSDLQPDRILQALGWVFAMTMLLAIIPALRASRQGKVQVLGG